VTPKYVAAYESLEEEFAEASALIEAPSAPDATEWEIMGG
jgi:hypothetical protein